MWIEFYDIYGGYYEDDSNHPYCFIYIEGDSLSSILEYFKANYKFKVNKNVPSGIENYTISSAMNLETLLKRRKNKGGQKAMEEFKKSKDVLILPKLDQFEIKPEEGKPRSIDFDL